MLFGRHLARNRRGLRLRQIVLVAQGGIVMQPTEKAKMLAGELYSAFDPVLVGERARAARLVARFNAGGDPAAILGELFGKVGEGSEIQPPFACDYGYNIRLGRNAFINYNCVFLDCAQIEIGDRLLMGPAVQLYAATHPLDAATRRAGLEYARPIRIGDDVWIGGGAIVMPGITIGDGSVVGAGSVVTRDVTPGTVVAGNPARVIRRLAGSAGP
jgi:maltose O-acetyltransferase